MNHDGVEQYLHVTCSAVPTTDRQSLWYTGKSVGTFVWAVARASHGFLSNFGGSAMQ